jgi:hypothetical protein
MELIDEISGQGGRDTAVLTRTFRHGRDIVRVRIRRNFYASQSSATADVLNSDRTWTLIAEVPPGNWHAAETPMPEVADSLAGRAAKILG